MIQGQEEEMIQGQGEEITQGLTAEIKREIMAGHDHEEEILKNHLMGGEIRLDQEAQKDHMSRVVDPDLSVD